ncbi:MAG: glutaredoxin domain-containing protein [Spirochaetaceae bacterium]|jgi:glutaredoxin|nr:glutaredoxin domain-containing protein [Spirochaetaceae bacterium]
MTTVAEIDNKIKQLKEQLSNVEGKKSEVYARIVGYYRSVVNWNKGKGEEYGERVNFSDLETRNIEKTDTPEPEVRDSKHQTAEAIEINFEEEKAKVLSDAASYTFFFKETCPNCPPVKAVIDSIEMDGNKINVDDSNGLTEAMNSSVYSAPTVILYNDKGSEIYRTGNAEKLKSFLKVKTA